MPRPSSSSAGKSKVNSGKTGSLFAGAREAGSPDDRAFADSRTWIAHIDGGARGNPGPAGFGVHIKDAAGKTVAELSEFLGHRTNNYAEYSGLIAALEYAVAKKCPSLKVVSDSELMVKQIRGESVEKRIGTGEFLATPANMKTPEMDKLLSPERFE